MPVTNVTWNDAETYVEWLAKMTGQSYRLPTEAEWEYLARAGTTTTYYWGNEIGNGQRQLHDMRHRNGTTKVRRRSVRSSPIRSDSYDVTGDVWQWLQDCFHKSYRGCARRRLGMDQRRLQPARRSRRFMDQRGFEPSDRFSRQLCGRQPQLQPRPAGGAGAGAAIKASVAGVAGEENDADRSSISAAQKSKPSRWMTAVPSCGGGASRRRSAITMGRSPQLPIWCAKRNRSCRAEARSASARLARFLP